MNRVILNSYVRAVADTLEECEEQDVYRLLKVGEDAGCIEAMSDYIYEVHASYKNEIEECLFEIKKEQSTSLYSY